MGFDTHHIRQLYMEMVVAKNDQIHKLAYDIAVKVVELYNESDDDSLWTLQDEINHALEIKTKFEK